MPRHPRLRLPDVPVLVIQRGNNRHDCFHADGDRLLYLDLLLAETRFFGVAVHAYVLMTNHVHVLMTPSQADGVERVMKLVGQRYAAYFNRRYGRVGTLWQGRYKSCLVEAASYLLTCHRYIENNPVRAGMVASAREYRWSSYRANAEGVSDPLVTAHPVVTGLSITPGQARQAYRAFVDEPTPAEALQAIRDATNGGYTLARGPLLAAVTERLRHPGVRRYPGRPRQGGQKINVV